MNVQPSEGRGNECAALIEEVIRYSSNVLECCARSPKGGSIDATILVLFRHILEMQDAIAVLVRASCVEPAKALLRSLFEGMLGIEYVLADDTGNRSLAYQVAHLHRQITFCRNFNRRTPEGEQFARKVESDPVSQWLKFDPKDLVRQEKLSVNALARDPLVPVEQEWQSTAKRLGRKHLDWFSLWGGPTSVEGLAQHLNFAASYQVFYRDWSGLVHAADGLSRLSLGPGEATLRPLRDTTALYEVALMAVLLGIRALRKVFGFYFPDRQSDLKQWYLSSMRSGIHRILDDLPQGDSGSPSDEENV